VALSEARYRSRFGGLWTDRDDADEELDRRHHDGRVTDEEAILIRNWINNGYIILDGAVPIADCDGLATEIMKAWSVGTDDVLMQLPGEHQTQPTTPDVPPNRMRLVDIFAARPQALRVLFASKIVRFITLIFDAEPLLFQSLTFECGSEQGIHQDTAYVVVSSPMELVASWTALEDVQPDSGELQYYEGSHRLPEYLFSGAHKSWDPSRDGTAQHDEWARLLHDNSQRLKLPLRTFRPKKGDSLIWSADLAHGGAPLVVPGRTRRSQVGHYCPQHVVPNYFNYLPERRHRIRVPEGWCSSEYYDLSTSNIGGELAR
jgi:phytanoyl-CoA hydroxylase